MGELGAAKGWKRWDAMVVGDLFLDLIFSDFPWLPQPGEESFAGSFARDAGGGTAITSCALARLGMKVAAAGVVGAEDGTPVLQRLRSSNVDVSGIRLDTWRPTGITCSVTSPHDRALFTYYGANASLLELLADEDFCSPMTRARHVHLAYPPEPANADFLFRVLHDGGCTVSLDAGWHPHWLSDTVVLSLLRSVDLLFPNEREARVLTGETRPSAMLEVFADAGFRNVALKLGPNGAALLSSGRTYTCPPFPVEPVDTTGAGDSFDAGFLYAWLSGCSPEQCLRVGCVCGALSTRALGGIEGLPTREEVEREMEEAGHA